MKRFLMAFSTAVFLGLFNATVFGQTNTSLSNAQTSIAQFNLDEETRLMLRKATGDNWFKKEAFMSAVLGGLLAVGAAWVTYKLEKARKKGEDQEFLLRVLKSIRTEMALFSVLTEDVTASLARTKDLEPFTLFFARQHDYFTVFQQNATHLGRIDPEQTQPIIEAYFYMKVLVDLYQQNDTYVAKLLDTYDDPAQRLKRRGVESQMGSLGDILRAENKKAQSKLAHAMKTIDAEISAREALRN